MRGPESRVFRAIMAGTKVLDLMKAIAFLGALLAIIGYVIFKGWLTYHK